MSNDNTLPEELQKQIEQAAKAHSDKWWEFHKFDKGLHLKTTHRYAYIAGATEYAPWRVRCEKALQYIGDKHSSGCIELNNYHINEIKSFLDGTK